MAPRSLTASVSFARTPVDEVSAKHGEILRLGWEEVGRGDPWAVGYRKDDATETELREVMGDYWVPADEIRSLLDK